MKENSVDKKEFIKNVSWIFGSKSIKSIFNSIEVVLLARYLGLETFGLLALVTAYVRIVNQLFDFRVWESVVKYVGEFVAKNQKENALSMIKLSYIVDIFTGVVAFGISILLADIGNRLFVKSDEGFILILIFSFNLLFSTANSTSEAIYRVFDRFKTITFVNSIESGFKLLLVLVLLILGFGIKEVLVAYVVTSFMGFFLRQIIVGKLLIEKGYGNWTRASVSALSRRYKEIGWFLMNTSFNATIRMASEGNVAVLVLGYFVDSSASGIYKVARAVIKVYMRIMDPIYETVFPKLVSLSASNLYGDFIEMIKFSMRSIMKFVIPFTLIVLIFADKIIGLIFGAEFIDGANTMRVLTVSTLFASLTFWLTPTLLAIGRPGYRSLINLLGILVYLSLLILLAPKYSYLGAGFALLLSGIVSFFISVYVGKKLLTNFSSDENT